MVKWLQRLFAPKPKLLKHDDLKCSECKHTMGNHRVEGMRDCGDCKRFVCNQCECNDGYILLGG